MIKIHLVQESGNPLVIEGEIRERRDLYDAWASIPDVSPSGDDPETYWEATQKTFTLLEQIIDMPPFAFVEAEGTWEFHPVVSRLDREKGIALRLKGGSTEPS